MTKRLRNLLIILGMFVPAAAIGAATSSTSAHSCCGGTCCPDGPCCPWMK